MQSSPKISSRFNFSSEIEQRDQNDTCLPLLSLQLSVVTAFRYLSISFVRKKNLHWQSLMVVIWYRIWSMKAYISGSESVGRISAKLICLRCANSSFGIYSTIFFCQELVDCDWLESWQINISITCACAFCCFQYLIKKGPIRVMMFDIWETTREPMDPFCDVMLIFVFMVTFMYRCCIS